jgi:hypothetical protein
MSWLLGNSGTSFSTDVASFWSNATGQGLTAAQKSEIADSATNSLTECQKTPSSPTCIELLKQNNQIVDYVSTKDQGFCNAGEVNIPMFDIGCLTYAKALMYALAFLLLIGVAYHVTINKLSK